MLGHTLCLIPVTIDQYRREIRSTLESVFGFHPFMGFNAGSWRMNLPFRKISATILGSSIAPHDGANTWIHRRCRKIEACRFHDGSVTMLLHVKEGCRTLTSSLSVRLSISPRGYQRITAHGTLGRVAWAETDFGMNAARTMKYNPS